MAWTKCVSGASPQRAICLLLFCQPLPPPSLFLGAEAGEINGFPFPPPHFSQVASLATVHLESHGVGCCIDICMQRILQGQAFSPASLAPCSHSSPPGASMGSPQAGPECNNISPPLQFPTTGIQSYMQPLALEVDHSYHNQ